MENSGRDEQPARADHGVRRGYPDSSVRTGSCGSAGASTYARSRPGSAFAHRGLEQAITALASPWGETIASNGGDAANWLGLTTQNAICTVYLTSGPARLLHFGAHQVKLLHAPRWQLAAAHGTAGTVIRAISWLGPRGVERSLDAVLPKLSLGSRSHLTPDSRTLSADAKKKVSPRDGDDHTRTRS